MTRPTDAPYFSFIHTVLTETCQLAQASFGRVSAQSKPGDNNQVLTQTDLDIGRHLIARIAEAFPGHNIIDEEAGVIDRGSPMTWVIDPIDGTSNFANGVPTYGTMLGLLADGQPLAGGLTLPAFEEVYVAEQGRGCWLHHTRLSVTAQTKLSEVLLAYGIDGHLEDPDLTYQESRQLAQLVLNCRNLRTSNSVFDIAMLLKGGYGAVLNQTSKIWDNVAQHILITEAGGEYTDIQGQPIDYHQPLTKADSNFTYCAANPTLHSQIQALLHQPA